jgi:chromosome segregation ATPase
MPRVTFVKKARKAIPNAGIEVGDSYYWWAFRYGGKHVSKTPPRPSQLTQSDYLSQAYSLQEQVEDIEPGDLDTAADTLREVADELRSLGEEQEEKRSNMPDQLQDGEIGEKLSARNEACEEIAGELESAADDLDSLLEEHQQEAAQEARNKLAELLEALKPHPEWHKQVKALSISDGELQDDLQEVADVMAGFPEKEGEVRRLIEWFDSAWQELMDTVADAAQNRIGEVDWDVDPC